MQVDALERRLASLSSSCTPKLNRAFVAEPSLSLPPLSFGAPAVGMLAVPLDLAESLITNRGLKVGLRLGLFANHGSSLNYMMSHFDFKVTW